MIGIAITNKTPSSAAVETAKTPNKVHTGQPSKAEDAAALKAQITHAEAHGHKIVTENGTRFIVEKSAFGLTIKTPIDPA